MMRVALRKNLSLVAILGLILGATFFLQSCRSDQTSSTAEMKQKEAQFYCPMHPHITSDREGSCPICGMDLVAMDEDQDETSDSGSHLDHNHGSVKEAQSALYVCPMHPQISSDKAGSCPICGMDLEKQESDQEESVANQDEEMPSGHGSVKLSLNKRQLIGVKSEAVEKRQLFKTITAAGRVAFDPELYTVLGEYREALRQRQLTSKSEIGDVRRNTQRMIESARTRLRIMGLSESQIKSISADSRLSDELLLPGGEDQVWIYADVYEMDLHNVREGDKAKVTGVALEGKTLEGEIFSVDEVINPETRTAKVRIRLDTKGIKLRPESFVNVTLLSDQGKHLSVSNEAIFDTGKQVYVFVNQGQGHLEPRNVELKFYAGEFAAIGNGLQEGEKVVTSGNFLIDSESRLKGIINSSKNSNKQTPQCPPGEEWHEQMNHCMKKVGE